MSTRANTAAALLHISDIPNSGIACNVTYERLSVFYLSRPNDLCATELTMTHELIDRRSGTGSDTTGPYKAPMAYLNGAKNY